MEHNRVQGYGIGASVLRAEDRRLLTGGGRYSADINDENETYAFFLRSPHAHARIRNIDCGAALRDLHVRAVLTATDAQHDGMKWLPHTPLPFSPPDISLENRGGIAPRLTKHYPLPLKRVRFVGEPVAIVIADTLNAAKDAAELIAVDYEPVDAVVDARMADALGSAQLWSDIPDNLCVDVLVGDQDATDAAFSRAKHIARLETWIPRVTAAPMETRAALARFDKNSDSFTLHAGAGGAVRLRRDVAFVLDVPETSVRVISGDVGGNFGSKNATSAEYPLLLWAAKRTGRPVKWVSDRSEAFLCDYQGRDLAVSAELALDENGRFLAMRGENTSNVGAYVVSLVPLTKGVETMTSVYAIPAACFRARAVFTNTPPTYPYRSAGRPEAMFVMERLIDIAAQDFGFDRVALRQKNLIPDRNGQYANPLGITYDGGTYSEVMERALALGEWSSFAARKRESAKNGRLRGIAIANYIEVTGGAPRERAEIIVHPTGVVELLIGTLSSGQGHETSFAQLICEWLKVPFDSVRVVTGDTDRITVGGGSHAGRSMRFAGIVVGNASAALIERAGAIAAHLFDCDAGELELSSSGFIKSNTDRAVSLYEIADAALHDPSLPEALKGQLAATSEETIRQAAFPYGSQLCELEIDNELGTVRLLKVIAIDDVGRAVNPLILHGQTHGGFVQGAGQALWEHCHYDRSTGQLLSASFMDYAMPRAAALPAIIADLSEFPAAGNPLGIRAGGEGGTTPALAVISNAVIDALSDVGIRHLDLPLTAETIWRALTGREQPT
jgi:carbon-monoxide dehydrogenase large subunit